MVPFELQEQDHGEIKTAETAGPSIESDSQFQIAPAIVITSPKDGSSDEVGLLRTKAHHTAQEIILNFDFKTIFNFSSFENEKDFDLLFLLSHILDGYFREPRQRKSDQLNQVKYYQF